MIKFAENYFSVYKIVADLDSKRDTLVVGLFIYDNVSSKRFSLSISGVSDFVEQTISFHIKVTFVS